MLLASPLASHPCAAQYFWSVALSGSVTNWFLQAHAFVANRIYYAKIEISSKEVIDNEIRSYGSSASRVNAPVVMPIAYKQPAFFLHSRSTSVSPILINLFRSSMPAAAIILNRKGLWPACRHLVTRYHVIYHTVFNQPSRSMITSVIGWRSLYQARSLSRFCLVGKHFFRIGQCL